MRRSLLGANACCPLVVLIDFLQVGSLGGPTRIGPVESLRISAGKFIVLQIGVDARLERMADLSGLHRRDQRFRRLEIVVRQLEGVVAQCMLGGADVLVLDPVSDALVLARAAVDILMLDGGRSSHGRMTLGSVAEHQLMAVGVVLEEIVYAFLFHEPADEREVRFIVLDAVIARCEVSLDFTFEIQSLQHQFENVRHRFLLENAGLNVFGEKPKLGHHLRFVTEQVGIFVLAGQTFALTEPTDDAVDVAHRLALKSHRDFLAEQLFELHLGPVLRIQPQVEAEQLGKCLRAGKGVEQQYILAQRSRDRHEAAVLCVGRHALLLLLNWSWLRRSQPGVEVRIGWITSDSDTRAV